MGPLPNWLTEAASDEPDQALVQAILAFLNAQSLDDLEQLITSHPALLTEAVDPIFAATLAQYEEDENATALIQSRQTLLQQCRQDGVEAVFAALRQAIDQATSE